MEITDSGLTRQKAPRTLIHTELIQTHHLQRIMPSTFLFLLTDPSPT